MLQFQYHKMNKFNDIDIINNNMKRIITYIHIIFFLFTSISILADNSDIHENAGTRAMTFLKIGVGAKAIGMGSLKSPPQMTYTHLFGIQQDLSILKGRNLP